MTLYTSLKRIAKESIVIPQIGDYVRTKDGLIAKYISYDKTYECNRFDGKIQWFYEYYTDDIYDEDWEDFLKEQFVKSSPNIIDLIEVGDYVNGFKVLEVFKNDIPGESVIAFENHNKYLSSIYDDEIKSIVTKEQFLKIQYKVGE